MKSFVLSFSLSLAVVGLAHAQAAPGTPEQLCRTYSSLPPSAILRLIKPAINASLKEREIPKRHWKRAYDCFAGALPTLRESVVAQCLVAQDPSAVITTAFTAAAEPCFLELATKPTRLFPAEAPVEPPTDPNTVPLDGAPAPTLTGEGILPALKGNN